MSLGCMNKRAINTKVTKESHTATTYGARGKEKRNKSHNASYAMQCKKRTRMRVCSLKHPKPDDPTTSVLLFVRLVRLVTVALLASAHPLSHFKRGYLLNLQRRNLIYIVQPTAAPLLALQPLIRPQYKMALH